MKKAVSTAMALSMMVGLMGVNASAYEAGSYDGVSITMLNTKSEIQDYLVDAAATWGELTGASLDVYTISDSGSPSQEIAARYAANNAPTLIMGDVQDVADICEEYGADLSNESWAANGGETYGVSVDGKLYKTSNRKKQEDEYEKSSFNSNGTEHDGWPYGRERFCIRGRKLRWGFHHNAEHKE